MDFFTRRFPSAAALRWFAFVVVLSGWPLVGGASAQWNPAALDSTFDGDGIATTTIGRSSYAAGAAIDDQGRIVVVGFALTDGPSFGDFAVARYHPTGELDDTFGVGGIVITAVGPYIDSASRVAIDKSGRIVVAGSAEDNMGNTDFAVVRYDTHGSLDRSFGNGGKVTTLVGDFRSFANAIALDAEDRIVVAGQARLGAKDQFAVVRYNVDGSLDGSYGDGGIAITPEGSPFAEASGVAVDGNGRVLLTGSADDGELEGLFALVRFDAAGRLDGSFGDGGSILTAVRSVSDSSTALAIDSQGRIVVVGGSRDPESQGTDFAVVRYDDTGHLDPTFGTEGKVTTSFGQGSAATALHIDSRGRLLVFGVAGDAFREFAVARYLSSGALDRAFGQGGIAINPSAVSQGTPYSVVIDDRGRFVVPGSAIEHGQEQLLIARYMGDCSLAKEGCPRTPFSRSIRSGCSCAGDGVCSDCALSRKSSRPNPFDFVKLPLGRR